MSLATRDLCVSRGGTRVLRSVSLKSEPGRLVAVIGPNGAGKSTLLEILSGRLRPDAGTITLEGAPLASWPRQALARRRAVLPQAPSLDFPFSVLDVVLLGRSPHAGRGNRARDLRIADEALRTVGLRELAHRSYTSLSGGERQRAQLARVLAQIWPAPAGRESPPTYLLLDEPTNNLDLAYQHALLASARALIRRNVGVIAVLHDPNLAGQYADVVAVLSAGELAAMGSPADVLTAETVARTFGIRAEILRHPHHGHPVLIPTGTGH